LRDIGPVSLALVTLLMVCVAASAFEGDGHVTGLIRDGAGNPLPGVEIILRSVDRPSVQISSGTDSGGRFVISSIDPATYRLTVSHASHGRLELSIDIKPGERLSLDLRLTGSSYLPALSLLDVAEAGQAIRFDSDLLQSLPLRRSIADPLTLIPGAAGRDLFNVHGGTVRGLRYTIDGIDLTDPQDGLGLIEVPFHAIAGAEVVLGNASAEIDAAEGSAVNLVARRGGRSFRGEANIFISNSSFQNKDNIREDKEISEYTPSFGIGGPLIEKSAWFYGAVTYRHADIKDTNGRFSPLELRGPETIGKLDWSAGSDWHIGATYLGFVQVKHRFHSPDIDVFEIAESNPDLITADVRESGNAVRFGAARRFSPGSIARAQLVYTARNQTTEPTSGDRGVPTVIDPYPEGGFTLYQGSIKPDWREDGSKRVSLSGSYATSLNAGGRHDLLGGAELEWTEIKLSGGFNGGYLTEFYTPAGLPFRRLSFRQNSGLEYEDNRELQDYCVYVEDTWTPADRLTINLGARLERRTGRNAIADVFVWNSLAPRVGVAYAPFPDGMTLLRAGFSRYNNPLLGSFIPGTPYELATEFFDAATGSWTTSPLNRTETIGYVANMVAPDTGAPYWDEWTLGVERELPGASVLSLSYVHREQKRILEDIERNLWPNFKKDKTEDIYDNEYNFFTQQPGLDGTRNPYLFLTNVAGLFRKYKGLEITLRSDLSPSLKFFGAFTWSKTEGNIDNNAAESSGSSFAYDTPNERINAEGYLSSDRRYELRLAAVYAAPKAFYVSLVMQVASGNPLDRMLLNPDNGHYEIRSAGRGSVYRAEGYINVDLRIEKEVSLPCGTVSLLLDAINLTDDDAPTAYTTSDTGFGLPVSRRAPRTIRWGIRYSF